MIRTLLTCCFVVFAALPLSAQSRAEIDLAKSTLRELQAQSVRGNREYCGLIWRDASGRTVVSKAVRGSRARCRYPEPPPRTKVLATYHTHGAFLKRYDNEVPSVLDVLADMSKGTNGYVSTPGGRLWFVNGRTGEIRLLCGPKCLPWDPRFIEGFAGPIAGKYSLDQLKDRQLGW